MAARARMCDLRAIRTIKHAKRERKVAGKLLGFTSAMQQRSVTYERQYSKLRLILLALCNESSLLGRMELFVIGQVISFLVPWHISIRLR